MADKNNDLTSDESVDMDHIKEMMGPLPNDINGDGIADSPKKKSAKPKTAKAGGIGASLKEFNDSLKAKMPGLGDADISKVEDQDDASLPKITSSSDKEVVVDLHPKFRSKATAAAASAAALPSKEGDTPPAPDDLAGDDEATETVPDTDTDTATATDSGVPLEALAEAAAEDNDDETDVEGEDEEPLAGDIESAKKALDPADAKAKEIDSSIDADDPGLDKAVDDIVASETDQLLAMEDEKKAEVTARKPAKTSKGGFKDRLYDWLHRPNAKWLAVYAVLGLLLLVIVLPVSRYFVLNTAGVRVKSSVIVVDEKTQQPLKNVKVSVGPQSAMTDENGTAVVEHSKLGPATLKIEKSAFAPVTQNVTLGWGSNPLGNFKLTPVGSQYTFIVTDFLSSKPIEKAEAVSGDGSAFSNKDGKLVLTLDTEDSVKSISVKITAAGFRDETINLTTNNKQEQAIKMVPSRKHVFVSKRSGKFDVYKSDVDGRNAERIVAGTGLERDDIALVGHPTDMVAAMVATRENVRNSDGYLLSTLYEVDEKTGELNKIDQSERIQIIGWTSDQRLVYVKIVAGASANNPKRQRLISYNTRTNGDSKELAASNSFNDVVMVGDKVYFAPSSAFQPADQTGFYRANADGSLKTTVLNKEVWNVFRTDYDTLNLSVGNEWYTNKIGSDEATKAAAGPAQLKSRLYVTSADKSKALWVDSRDGKGVLVQYDTAAKKETTLVSRDGLKNPVIWLNDHYVIFRVSDGKETADYILNTEGGEARKIIDVTDSGGVETWYYY